MKLDTQGTELAILKGGQEALRSKRIGLIFSEVSFVRSYQDQCLFSDLDLFLRDQGYEYVDCRFYPDAVAKEYNLTLGSVYEQARFSVGGDAIFAPSLDLFEAKDPLCFQIGLLLLSLGYFGQARGYLVKYGLTAKDRALLFSKFMKIHRKKAVLKSLIPSYLYHMLYKLFSR